MFSESHKNNILHVYHNILNVYHIVRSMYYELSELMKLCVPCRLNDIVQIINLLKTV